MSSRVELFQIRRRMPRWRQRLLLRLLGEFMLALRSEGKEQAEDAVADVMDLVSGWCSPRRRLSNSIGTKK